MITENLSTLKIHKLTKEQYERELAAGRIDDNAIYLTPDEELDLSIYATVEEVNNKADKNHKHVTDDIQGLQNSLDSLFENAKDYADNAVSGKANSSHIHDDRYYTETEINEKLSTVNTSISNIISGSTPVKESEHATKATQDGNGKVIADTYETKTDASAKLDESKTYADNAATTAANKVKDDLLNGAGAAYDTLKELGELIDDNKDAIDALEDIASGKANATHGHAISEVTGLQNALDEKVPITRTVNNKQLNNNITLLTSDIPDFDETINTTIESYVNEAILGGKW